MVVKARDVYYALVGAGDLAVKKAPILGSKDPYKRFARRSIKLYWDFVDQGKRRAEENEKTGSAGAKTSSRKKTSTARKKTARKKSATRKKSTTRKKTTARKKSTARAAGRSSVTTASDAHAGGETAAQSSKPTTPPAGSPSSGAAEEPSAARPSQEGGAR